MTKTRNVTMRAVGANLIFGAAGVGPNLFALQSRWLNDT